MYLNRFLIKSILFFILFSCQEKLPAQTNEVQIKEQQSEKIRKDTDKSIIVGAERIEEIKLAVENKKVGIVGNQTSIVGNTHIVDSFLAVGINVVKIFSPEHGFRGDADAGEKVSSNVDAKTGLPVISLYGNNRKPTVSQLSSIDALIFDLQDVGARFYTYISTLHYVLEAAGENNISVIVLDRPNPNGNYVDGPIRKKGFESFVGVDPLPVVHGMTIGEIAQMINGEKWLKNGVKCDLTVISCLNYDRNQAYSLPVSPSPNLRSDESILLYPSLCFFEGTTVSLGRGTEAPFEIFGHPQLKGKSGFDFEFTPVSSFGSKNPPLENKLCYGKNLHDYYQGEKPQQLEIKWVIEAYQAMGKPADFFLKNNFFDLLAGTDELRKQIIAGKSEEEIRESWKEGLEKFKLERERYLIYKGD